MEAEVQELLRHALILGEEKWAGITMTHVSWLGRHCVVAHCGVGKVFGAMVSQHCLDAYHPRALIFTGVAGALNPDLNIGDVVVSRDLIQHDVDGRALGFERGRLLLTDWKVFAADDALRRKAMSARLEGFALREGRILTGDQFMTRESIRSHAYLTDELSGDAVEMEGAAVAQVCTLNQTPFLIVRTISDKADGDAVKDFNAFLPVVAHNSYAVLRAVLE